MGWCALRVKSPRSPADRALPEVAHFLAFGAVEAVPIIWLLLLGHVPLAILIMTQVMAAFAIGEYVIRSGLRLMTICLNDSVGVVRSYRALIKEIKGDG
jgi:hypothetical protein